MSISIGGSNGRGSGARGGSGAGAGSEAKWRGDCARSEDEWRVELVFFESLFLRYRHRLSLLSLEGGSVVDTVPFKGVGAPEGGFSFQSPSLVLEVVLPIVEKKAEGVVCSSRDGILSVVGLAELIE